MALVLVAPFVAVYEWLFVYPTIQMVILGFTNSPLIGEGTWKRHRQLYQALRRPRVQDRGLQHRLFRVADRDPGAPSTPALAIALIGSAASTAILEQSIVLAAFFLPFILPVTVVYLIWWWIFDQQFGLAQYVIEPIVGAPIAVWRRASWFMPMAALVTIWWTNGFSVLLFLAGLRNISPELHELRRSRAPAAGNSAGSPGRSLAGNRAVLTIQLILQSRFSIRSICFARRRHQPEHRAGPVHLQAGVPAEQGRLRRDGRPRAVHRRHHRFGAAVPAAAGARRAMSAAPAAAPTASRFPLAHASTTGRALSLVGSSRLLGVPARLAR